MTNAVELQARIDHLEQLLRERDRKDAEECAAAAAAQAATEDAIAATARVEAATQEREQIRRGSWTSYYLSKADQNAPLDLLAIGEAIPADKDRWPPGVDPTTFHFTGGTPTKQIDVSETLMGRLLNKGGRL